MSKYEVIYQYYGGKRLNTLSAMEKCDHITTGSQCGWESDSDAAMGKTFDEVAQLQRMETALIPGPEVRAATPMHQLIPAIEEAYRRYGSEDAQMPAKTYLELPEFNGDFRAMPAYLRTDRGPAAGLKWVNVHPDNAESGRYPTVMGVYIYADPETGFPLAVMDGTELTMRRTGAAAGVATDHLASPDAATFGIVGAGAQAPAQAEAVTTVRSIEEIVIADQDADRAATVAAELRDLAATRVGTVEEAVGCDVCSTITPVRSPIVSRDAVGHDTHINAMGADAPGKQELDPHLLQDATVIIDDPEQAHHSGEVNVPLTAGQITPADIAGTLTAVIEGEVQIPAGRGPTVFDSTGLAIQDVAAAQLVMSEIDLAQHTGVDIVGVHA